MRNIIELDIAHLTPTLAKCLNQGMAGRANIPERITSLLDSALELFGQLA